MTYEFSCCGEVFEIRQPMLEEHKADCPKCGKPAQRMFSMTEWIWADSAYRSDGSLREDKDYAPVMRG